jgi:hypothetical protein
MVILLEIAEMVFAFIGVIGTMQLIASLIKNKDTDICAEQYFIGVVNFNGQGTVNGKKRNINFIINLYMKELSNGKTKRDYAFIGDDTWKEKFFKETEDGQQLRAWKEGGKFPEGFQAIEPLGEMLNRMLKKKMGVPDA